MAGRRRWRLFLGGANIFCTFELNVRMATENLETYTRRNVQLQTVSRVMPNANAKWGGIYSTKNLRNRSPRRKWRLILSDAPVPKFQFSKYERGSWERGRKFITIHTSNGVHIHALCEKVWANCSRVCLAGIRPINREKIFAPRVCDRYLTVKVNNGGRRPLAFKTRICGLKAGGNYVCAMPLFLQYMCCGTNFTKSWRLSYC